jgi:hypothetical protein
MEGERDPVSDSGPILKTGCAGLQGPYTEARLCTLRHSRVSCLLDNPPLVFRVGFVEPVDHPDQRADMLLGHPKGVDRGSGQAPNE